MSDPAHAAPPSAGQLEAMISLLTDESEAVVAGCREALLAAGGELAEGPLRARLARARGHEHWLLRRVLADLHGPRLERELLELLTGDAELERGSLLIGQLVDGGDAPRGMSATLDRLAEQLREALPITRDAASDADALRRVLVTSNGLRGAAVDRARLTDAVVHGVTTHRRGIPMPLCIVWLLVARRAGVPLVGVNMPGHMLVRHAGSDTLLLLDPFHDGLVSEPGFWRGLLVRQGLSPDVLEQLDASDVELLARSLRNVLALARRDGERVLAERVERLLLALAEEQADRADAVDDARDGDD